jgi:hypothetical protein
MHWFGKPAEAQAQDLIQAGALGVPLDEGIFVGKLDALVRAAEAHGGVQAFAGALGKKHELFRRLLAPEQLEALDREGMDAMLEYVFSARRKIPPAIERAGLQGAAQLVRELIYGSAPVAERLASFAERLGTHSGKVKRAAWDFGAELLHFRDPEHYPLMCRWVWDPGVKAGALREFVRHNDGMPDIPIDGSPESFEGARVWLGERLAEQGFYRDVPFLIDLVLAQAYADYMSAMSSGLGLLNADFGAKDDPIEPVVKLLGIDPPRRGGRSRIRVKA